MQVETYSWRKAKPIGYHLKIGRTIKSHAWQAKGGFYICNINQAKHLFEDVQGPFQTMEDAMTEAVKQLGLIA